MNGQGVIRQRLTGVLLSNRCTPARLEFVFTAADPFAVTLAVHMASLSGAHPSAMWTLARELVSRGLHDAVGDGQVRVRPLSTEWTTIELGCLDEGVIVIVIVATEDLRAFVERSFALVPDGTEKDLLDWDALLRHWGVGA